MEKRDYLIKMRVVGRRAGFVRTKEESSGISIAIIFFNDNGSRCEAEAIREAVSKMARIRRRIRKK